MPFQTPALADAVNLHLVASDARPGGNVTGIMPYVDGLPAKQMELAREVVPGARMIGVLNNGNDAKAPPQLRELQAAGANWGSTPSRQTCSRPMTSRARFRCSSTSGLT